MYLFVLTAAGVGLCANLYIVQCAVYIFLFDPLRSTEIFKEIRRVYMFRLMFSKQCFVI